MREVSSQVLQGVARTLQLAGQGSQLTHFHDGELQQILDVGPLVRRGGTLADSGGLFQGLIVNNHVGASTLQTDIDPYNVGVGAVNYFPRQVGPEFDIWVYNLQCELQIPGTISSASMSLLSPVARRAFGSGGPLRNLLQLWASFATASPGTFGLPVYPPILPMRVPRGMTLTLDSISTGITEVRVTFTLGLLPAGLGQDVAL